MHTPELGNRIIRFRRPVIHESDRNNEPESSREAKNVVVFGESGVGKSSLINLLAGEKVSETSSGALGCTLEYKRHQLELDNQQFSIWDTAGLDEGTQGSVPADKAEAYLKQLLHELAKSNGIDLLVYCVRGSRIRSALLTNYHIFYSAICRKKVPIAIVITGLENQEGGMETWWGKNEAEFLSLKMHFDNHACVTTLGESPVENPILLERRGFSREVIIKMITTTCRTRQWRPPERSWFESAYSDVRAMLPSKENRTTRLPTIIMCETFQDPPGRRSISFQNPVALSLSTSPIIFRNPVSNSNDSLRSKLPFEESVKRMTERPYYVYRVPPSPKPAPPSEGTVEEIKKATVVKRGANLLVFCVRMEEAEPRDVKSQWEHFNSTYGGDLAPQIVVVVGAPNQCSAETWWKEAMGTLAKSGVDVAYWPSDVANIAMGFEDEAARKQLQSLIQDRCIDCGKVAFARNEKLFRRSLLLDISSLWGKSEDNYQGDGPGLDPDMLTRAGIWYGTLEQAPTDALAFPTSPTTSLPE